MSWKNERDNRLARIEQIIRDRLPEEGGYQRTVIEAMNYSVLAGGKRIRPLMMYETYRMYAESRLTDGEERGGKSRACPEEALGLFMAAIEMIHTYSLVHDDLPAMDNDEYRRGKKTTHAVYGEAMAILAGDGLLNHAFTTAAKAFEVISREYAVKADTQGKEGACGKGDMEARMYACVGRALGILAVKAGVDGMLGGQCADIEAEDRQEKLSMDKLLFIHEKKTAAMIQSALTIGAVLGGAPQRDVDLLEEIGYHVGVAFQIRDDILDVEGNSAELGKPVGSDERNRKETYVTLTGLDGAQKDVERISAEAMAKMERLTVKNDFLTELIRQMVYRTK